MPTRKPARPTNPDLTELAATEFIERHGPAGLGILRERADLAEELGHKFAAETWRSMAAAASRLLRVTTQAAAPLRPRAGPTFHIAARRH